MKLLLLTRYDRLGASSRLRAMQYLPYLQARGWQVRVAPFFSDTYLEQLYTAKSRWREVLLAFWRRLGDVRRAGGYDLLWIEKELFPFLPATTERTLKALGIPYLVDYDDATFHRYDQHWFWPVRALLRGKIDAVMKQATMVIAGNNYLARRARHAGAKRVEIVPTVIDLDRYPASGKTPGDGEAPLVIGWIGTPSTSQYLHPLKNVFQTLQSAFNVQIVAVGTIRENLMGLPVVCWPWSEDMEVDTISKFDVGIMPLDDSPWERGKCGYKLIQYMACGLPVVASPVGMNVEIVDAGVNGFLANTEAQWRDSLGALLADAATREKMGRNGRAKVESRYCLQKQAPRMAALLRQLVSEDWVWS